MSLQSNMRYIQIAFNKGLGQVYRILPQIPPDPRIIIEAGTPFIKREGIAGIRAIRRRWRGLLVADLKVTDGAYDEVNFAASAGANAVTVMGSSPTSTLQKFINACAQRRVYSMIDMLGVTQPLKLLLPLKGTPDVVVIHKGRDQESNAKAMIRYKDITKIKSKHESFISVAGGLVPTRVRTAFFNGADIAILNVVSPNDPNEGIPDQGNIRGIIHQILNEVGS